MGTTTEKRLAKTVVVRDSVETRLLKIEPAEGTSGVVKVGLNVLNGVDEPESGETCCFGEAVVWYRFPRGGAPTFGMVLGTPLMHDVPKPAPSDEHFGLSFNARADGVLLAVAEYRGTPAAAHRVSLGCSWLDIQGLGTKVF